MAPANSTCRTFRERVSDYFLDVGLLDEASVL